MRARATSHTHRMKPPQNARRRWGRGRGFVCVALGLWTFCLGLRCPAGTQHAPGVLHIWVTRVSGTDCPQPQTGGGAWAASSVYSGETGWGGSRWWFQQHPSPCRAPGATALFVIWPLSISCLCFPSSVPLHSSLTVFWTDSQSVCHWQVSLSRSPKGLSGASAGSSDSHEGKTGSLLRRPSTQPGERMGKVNTIYYSSHFALYLGEVSVPQQCWIIPVSNFYTNYIPIL